MPALQGGQAALDRLLAPVAVPAADRQIGVRSVARRRRRSITTVLQIALAVGTLLAVLALDDTVTKTTNDVWNQAALGHRIDTAVGTQFDSRGGPLDPQTPGVAACAAAT